MRMTVGPLPTAVYWRRRAIVLGVLLLIVVIFWTSCSSPPKKTSSSANPATSQSATTAAPPAPTVSATILTPTTGGPPPSTSAPAVPATNTSGPPPCSDTDLSLVATPEVATAFRGVSLRFKLNVKNTSGHPCVRDLGADHQELYLQSGTTKLWSSDACDAPHGSEMRVMEPEILVTYTNNWNGKSTANGCANRAIPDAGKYQLFARLDTKLSDPVQVQLT